MVFQSYALYPHVVSDNLTFGLRMVNRLSDQAIAEKKRLRCWNSKSIGQEAKGIERWPAPTLRSAER